MEIVRKIVGAYLVVTGIAVAVHLAVTPLYHDGSPDYPVWEIVNYFIAIGVAIVLVVGILRKRAIREQEVDTLTYLRTSFVFYGGIVLASLFFWQWFWQLKSGQRDRTVGQFAHHLLPGDGYAVHGAGVDRGTENLERWLGGVV